MEKEFVPYELALALKALGFDEPCFGYYEDTGLTITFPSTSENGWKWVGNSIIPTKNTSAPTYSQAFRWFREEHYLISSIYQLSVNVKTGLSSFEYMIDKLNNLGLSQFIEDFPYNTYEEAEIACLEKLIEIVESKTEK
jgi:hypothetical protein